MQLNPFGERVPYAEYLNFATKWMEFSVGISGWGIGPNQKNLSFKKNEFDVNIAPIICIESIFPLLVRNFVLMDANLLSVITNDGWYDNTIGPEQHLYMQQCVQLKTDAILPGVLILEYLVFINQQESHY